MSAHDETKKASFGTTLVSRIHELPIVEADARVFVTVASVGSFTAAAALHAMSPSAVSKAISRLESALGISLLARTTRKLRLTDEGAAFRERCAKAFDLLAEAVEEANAGASAIGSVRVGLPPLFGTYLVAPLLPKLLALHPRLRVELVTLVRLSDFIDAGVDCAIAVGELPDSSLIARPLGHGVFVTVASPAYLQEHGTPARPEQLQAHLRIGFTRADGQENPWWFRRGEEPSPFDVNAQVRSDDMHHVKAMAIAGLGIAQLPLFVVSSELESGRLVRLFDGLEVPPRLASLVYPKSQATPRRVRAFVDFMLAQEAAMPGVSRA